MDAGEKALDRPAAFLVPDAASSTLFGPRRVEISTLGVLWI
jgi:hypothetical protein